MVATRRWIDAPVSIVVAIRFVEFVPKEILDKTIEHGILARTGPGEERGALFNQRLRLFLLVGR